MLFRKIVGPMRISSASGGTEQTYNLPPSGGGSMVKTLQYFVKVTSTDPNVEIGMNVQHGPQVGWATTLKDDIVAYPGSPVAEGDTLAGAIGAAASNSEVVGEIIMPVVKIKETGTPANQVSAMVEIFEMRKPF